MADMPDINISWIFYLGGPNDGERTATSDGVREMLYGGYYEAAIVKGKRVSLWHQTEEPKWTPERDNG